MAFVRRMAMVCLLVCAGAILNGCGGGSSNALPPPHHGELAEIHEMYNVFIKRNEKNLAPAKLSELANKDSEVLYPRAVKGLQDGTYQVVFGVTSKDGDTLLAYEKDAPNQGGAVVMANGTVKKMTADQVKAAKK